MWQTLYAAADEKVVGNIMNTWNGFTVEARKPEGKSVRTDVVVLDHGKNIICSKTKSITTI